METDTKLLCPKFGKCMNLSTDDGGRRKHEYGNWLVWAGQDPIPLSQGAFSNILKHFFKNLAKKKGGRAGGTYQQASKSGPLLFLYSDPHSVRHFPELQQFHNVRCKEDQNISDRRWVPTRRRREFMLVFFFKKKSEKKNKLTSYRNVTWWWWP